MTARSGRQRRSTEASIFGESGRRAGTRCSRSVPRDDRIDALLPGSSKHARLTAPTFLDPMKTRFLELREQVLDANQPLADRGLAPFTFGTPTALYLPNN